MSSETDTERLRPRHVERVRVTAAHHPLFGQSVAVVRRKRHEGEPYLVIEGPDGGRQLLAARCAEPAGTLQPAAAAVAMFTPGSLRALAELVATLRGAPPPAPEARHAPDPEAVSRAALERLPARDAAALGPAVDRAAATAAPGRARSGRRARGAVP